LAEPRHCILAGRRHGSGYLRPRCPYTAGAVPLLREPAAPGAVRGLTYAADAEERLGAVVVRPAQRTDGQAITAEAAGGIGSDLRIRLADRVAVARRGIDA